MLITLLVVLQSDGQVTGVAPLRAISHIFNQIQNYIVMQYH